MILHNLSHFVRHYPHVEIKLNTDCKYSKRKRYVKRGALNSESTSENSLKENHLAC